MTSLTARLNSAKMQKGCCDISHEPYGKFLVTKQGRKIIESDDQLSKRIMGGFYELYKHLEDIKWNKDDPRWLTLLEFCTNTITNMFLEDLNTEYLGGRTEGMVYKVNFPDIAVAVKFFYNHAINKEANAFGQFNALLNPPKNTAFRTPKPYFATGFIGVMEDLSTYQDFFQFVIEHPGEEKQLVKYLQKLHEKDPLRPDISDVTSMYYTSEALGKEFISKYLELTGLKRSSVFVINFNPRKEQSEKRYKLATVDVFSE